MRIASSRSRDTLGTGGSDEPAYWYTFTRDVRDGVNLVTGAVLVSV
jgi:hypothetical protein